MTDFTPEEITAMAKEAGIANVFWTPAMVAPFERFAALVAEKAAAKERERLFGAGRQLDGQMRLQLTRWEDGECFAAAAHFNAEQTHCGDDDLLPRAVDRLDENLDACIDAAIRARGQKGGV